MNSNAQRAERSSNSSPTSDEVVKALELDVVLGRLRPRERLIEDELIAQFNAKRHVIRSALTEMERLGLVDRRPNRGAVVREYTPEEVNELYQFRALLHTMA
ncbi:MAG: GntR family transcriptional regulator, partial [Pseudomonadota bacterium]